MTPISQTLQKTISRKCLSFLALFIFFFFNNYFAFSQQNKIETGNFFVSNYSRSFLNSISGNWSILQDPDGVIYIGNTYDGILIYDGQKIRRVNDGHGSPKLGLTRSLLIDSKARYIGRRQPAPARSL